MTSKLNRNYGDYTMNSLFEMAEGYVYHGKTSDKLDLIDFFKAQGMDVGCAMAQAEIIISEV